MGVDYNGLKLLLWAKNLGGRFDQTLTLGRQGFDVSPTGLRRALNDFGLATTSDEVDRCFHREPMTALYAEALLGLLGARKIVSVDMSDFEGATLLHDLNEPFPQKERGRYDFVLDGGTLEHVFNYPQALHHCLELLRVGGHFLTIAPAQNLMGHGFYQISPELFFRVFTSANGFAIRKVVLFECNRADAPFLEVLDPALTGHRAELESDRAMFVAALAERISDAPMFRLNPQQSDYAASWENCRMNAKSSQAHKTGVLSRARAWLNPHLPHWLRRFKGKLSYRLRRNSAWFGNNRQFRQLSAEEIFRERSAPLSSRQPAQ